MEQHKSPASKDAARAVRQVRPEPLESRRFPALSSGAACCRGDRVIGKEAVSGGNTAAGEGSGRRAVLPGDERAATLNGADQAPGAEFFHGPADSAVRHAIAAGQVPLGEQPCPGRSSRMRCGRRCRPSRSRRQDPPSCRGRL